MTELYIHGTRDEEQERLSALNRITNQSFVRYLGDCNKLKVCDFGCGLGNLINDIITEFPSAEITGLEISEDQYKKAMENILYKKQVNMLHVNLFDNNLPDDYFDVTYCRYVLEHIQYPIQAVREMLRVTKPGGRVICQENDLHNVIYYPDIPGHDIVMKQFCNLQIEMKGDPFIGRKLFPIYHKAGAKNITLAYEPEIYSEDKPESYKAWMNNSLNIFLGAREKLLERKLVDEKVFDSVCATFKARIHEPEGVALFHWNRITAYK